MQSLLRLPAVMVRTGLPRTTIYELMAAGDFPKPVRLTVRSVAWPSNDIDLWIKSRVQADVTRSNRATRRGDVA